MTIAQRRILYLSFSVLFLLLAPTLVFFAKGYRLDLQHHRVYKTGLLVLSVRPRPETVLLDGQTYRVSGSPTRITGIIPGDHNITLRRNGYHAWARSFSIQSGTSTEVKDIQLIRDEAAQRLLSGVAALRPSPNGHVLAALQADQVTILSTDGSDRIVLAMPDGTQPVDVVWSPTNAGAAIVTSAGTTLLYQEHQTTLMPLPSFPLAEKALWDQRQPQTLYILNKQALFSYDILSHDSALLEHNVADTIQHDDSLMLLQPEQAGMVVRERFRDGTKNILATLTETQGTFLPSPSDFVTVLASQHRLMLLRASVKPRQALTLSDVNYASWNQDGSRLVYGNDYELSVMELAANGTETRLLNRTSGGVQSVWWLEPYQALLVQREKTVAVFDNTANATGDFLPFLALDVRDVHVDRDNERALFLLADGGVMLKKF